MITWIKVSRVKTSVLQFRWKKIRLHTCTIGDVNVRYHWMYCRTCRVCSHFDLDVPTEIRHRLTPPPPPLPPPHLFPYGREGERRRGHARILKEGGWSGGPVPLQNSIFFLQITVKNYQKYVSDPRQTHIIVGPPGEKNLDPRMRRYMYMYVNMQWMMCIFF